MTEEIQVLWTLSGLDERLVTLNNALKRLPQLRRELEDRVSSQRGSVETHQKRVGDLQLKRRQLEHDIEALVAEERKFQSQLPMIKKNEEYTALLHEIAGAQRRRSDRETELLVLMDEEESIHGQKPTIDRELKSIETETAERLNKLAAEERAERDQVAGIEAERASLMQRLPAATRSRYERVRTSKEGRAVVAILKGACGGCYRGQPPQALQEARRGDRLLTCDGCGRLLIWPPDAPGA